MSFTIQGRPMQAFLAPEPGLPARFAPASVEAVAGALLPFIECLLHEAYAAGQRGAQDYLLQILPQGLLQQPEEKEKLLTVEQTAAMLNVSPQTVHNWAGQGLLQRRKLGKRTYFLEAEVMAAAQKQTLPDGTRKYARRKPGQRRKG